jgi:methionine-rich copper-binding protein CopC
MKQMNIRSLASVAALVLLTSAFALHLRLVKSAPRDGEIVTSIPTEIRLWFSQKPEARLTTIKLLREDSTEVQMGRSERTDDSLSVKLPLSNALVPGTYIVSWRSVSKDGHAVRGSYHFNMVPGPPARKQTNN